jgi:predicted Fe-Mo cluster-binding NifX family protein
MTVAVTTWNDRVSPVFDVARQVELLEVEGTQIVARRSAPMPGMDAQRQAQALLTLQPQVLICGAISRPLAEWLAAAGIELFPFTTGEIDRVVDAWMAGSLPNSTHSMPGCRGRPGWCRGGGGRGRHGRCRAGRQNGPGFTFKTDNTTPEERPS